MSRAHRGAVVGTGLVGGVEHVHHSHAKVHPQGVDHKEAKAREQRQAVARGAAYWSCRRKKVVNCQRTKMKIHENLDKRNRSDMMASVYFCEIFKQWGMQHCLKRAEIGLTLHR